jgi:hypothetical protein
LAVRLYILYSAAIVLLLVSPSVEAGTVSVTVVNQAEYPWLVKGSYADYLGGVGGYVLANGTLLLNLFSSSNLVPTPSANTSLDWTILNRTGNVAWLQMQYHASGCDVSQEQAENYDKSGYTGSKCTKFDFDTSLTLEVNIVTREAYVGGQSVGVINLWAPPLLVNQTAPVGTAFVNGVRYDLASESSPLYSTSSVLLSGAYGGPLAINESGTVYGGPFTVYLLGQATFGTGHNQTLGWLKVYGPNGTAFFPKTAPSGIYDYYNGLALTFSQPEYPIPQIVCSAENGQSTNCSYTTYATTLGSYFRSAGGDLFLNSTNIPVVPSQSTGGPSGPTLSSLLLDIVLVAVASVVIVSLGVIYWRQKK